MDHWKSWEGPPVAILWDQSLIWGLICIDTLERMGIPYHLLSASDVAGGRLEVYRVLVVPGGWAAHKIRALGEGGKKRLVSFLHEGGGYIGFCGGAGMALSRQPSLGIVPLERMALSDRLPNASGQVMVRGIEGHPAWRGLPEILPVSIWWPSQFAWHPLPGCLPLATYLRPGADFTIADLPLADLENPELRWQEWESVYGINLNPVRLMGQPAMVEMHRGKGTLILSYPHLETPGDDLANRLFANILGYLSDTTRRRVPATAHAEGPPSPACSPPSRRAVWILKETEERVQNLIAFGERHLLWNWRRPWLLQWRRGIRGLEYGMLAVVMRRVVQEAETCSAMSAAGDCWVEQARRLDRNVETFVRLASRLLLEEKVYTQNGQLSKLGSINATVDSLRRELFGEKMNHGGLCRTLFDDLDPLLLNLLRHRT